MRSPICAAAVLSVLLASTSDLMAQKGTPEPRLGISFNPPKGWVELPADCDRHATVRLFSAPRALAGRESTHTPLLRVMFFPKGGDASKDVVDNLPRATPFRSLEDFAQRGLGAKEVAKQAEKVGGVEGQRVTGKAVPGERILIGQTFPLEDGEAAVCVELLAVQADKLKKELDATLGSLAAIPRTPMARLDPPWVTDAEWAKKDVAARRAAHRKWAEEFVAQATKAPEAGYKVQKSKYWTVLSATDAGYTKKATAAAEAAREWLAKKLPELTKEAPLPAVLRIFDSMDQYNAFVATRNDSREYSARSRELHCVNDRDNGGPTGFGMVLRAVLWQVFDDTDPGVLPALPRWLDNGCWEFLRSSHFDGKKLEFAQGDVEKGRIEYYKQKNQPMPALWDLMQEHIQPSPTDGTVEQVWGYTPECSRLLRWFWQHDGLKAFDKPGLLVDYVRALGTAYGKLGPDPTADVATVGLTEAQQKDANGRRYKWRDAVLVETNNLAIPLQVEVWKAINEKWLKWNADFK